MPIVDMPLHELRSYRGINPKPDDFEEYWARALAELDATEPQPQLIPSSAIHPRNTEIFDLWFTGVGGARIYAKFLRPTRNNDSPTPAVLEFHGYTGNSGDWADKLRYPSEGVAIACMDCRGQGGRSEDPGGVKGNTHAGHIIRGLADSPDKLLFRSIFLDTVQLARVIMAMPGIDSAKVATCGGSQGGALAVACASLEPRIARCASVFPFLSDYKRVWEMDLAKDAYAELRTYLRMFDPLHERVDDMFRTLGYIDIHHLAPRIQAEVLMGISLMDTICPPSTQFAVFNAISAPKKERIYPDFGHENLPGMNDAIFDFVTWKS